jgi:trigger factor
MQVSLTATGGLERRLEVAVPEQRVTTEVEQRLKKISRTARLKGFRPGKAPYAVVRKQFGEQVHAEVVGDLMRSTFAEALDQEKLTPAGGPRIEPITVEPGTDLKYAAVFEVLPEVKLKPVEGITLERPTVEVTDADVDAMIESMRRQRPVFSAVDRAAQDTDRVTIDYVGTVDGEPLKDGEAHDVHFVMGDKKVWPEFENTLRGVPAGESRSVSISFPAEHANAQLAGKTAQFALTVKKVESQTLPEVDEEFCRQFAVQEGGVEALRTEVRSSMAREVSEVVRQRLRAQVLDALYRDNRFEVPRGMVDEQIQQLQVDMARRIGARDVSQLPPREQFEEPARRRVALGLLLGELVRVEELKLDRERVQAKLSDLAASYPNPDEVRRAYLQSADAMRQIESSVMEDQVIDRVIEKAKVEERPTSFKELSGFGQASENSENPT